MDILKFCVAGINYKKADAELRSLFAVSNQQYISILNNAASFDLTEVFVLSTCNRTKFMALPIMQKTLSTCSVLKHPAMFKLLYSLPILKKALKPLNIYLM
jgi:glutamyl-tRNA reductase